MLKGAVNRNCCKLKAIQAMSVINSNKRTVIKAAAYSVKRPEPLTQPHELEVKMKALTHKDCL